MRSAKDHLVFPLDVASRRAAQALVCLLADEVGMFKVGLELFIRSGPDLVRWIEQAGTAKLFLDLKLHDIPATVKRAMAQVADLGVFCATVHCGESRAMLEAAVEGAGARVRVLGVTVLTSTSPRELVEAGYQQRFAGDLQPLVMRKAAMARDAGCAGVVCSGREVGAIKTAFGGGFLAVTPGIRPHAGPVAQDDQFRVVTPAMAIRGGADYVVIGRPIRDAANPQAAAQAIVREIEGALDQLAAARTEATE
jgi:orotidine-5'-phosphate decarboxylase